MIDVPEVGTVWIRELALTEGAVSIATQLPDLIELVPVRPG